MENLSLQDEPHQDHVQLLEELLDLHADILRNAEARLAAMGKEWPGQNSAYSAFNLSTYLAFRRHDIRPLQERLTRAGLSSLGRAESNIIENIERVIHLLCLATGYERSAPNETQWHQDNLTGKQFLEERSNALFGKLSSGHYTRIMTTLPCEAADSNTLINNLVANGMNCARINCAHDDEAMWERMVDHVRQTRNEFGLDCRIYMDLAGLKIRTAKTRKSRHNHEMIKLFEGNVFELRCDAKSSVPERINPLTGDLVPTVIAASSDIFLKYVNAGDSVWFDDGKLGSVIEEVHENGVCLRVTHAGPKGVRIKPNKGINFPDTCLDIPTLTDKDLKDLDFVCSHADILGVSFVQNAEDLQMVIAELEKRGSQMPVVAKIESQEAVNNLPDILFAGLNYSGEFGLMIARGDLAVEIGSVRMAEIQEEILWLCEAAHVPVIWATQVLETLAKKGVISRPEITDAAMAVRADCVMLNKGQYITSAVAVLREILNRMQAHQYKKVSRLRALHW